MRSTAAIALALRCAGLLGYAKADGAAQRRKGRPKQLLEATNAIQERGRLHEDPAIWEQSGSLPVLSEELRIPFFSPTPTATIS